MGSEIPLFGWQYSYNIVKKNKKVQNIVIIQVEYITSVFSGISRNISQCS